MIDASENGAATMAYYMAANPPDPARALFDAMAAQAAASADRIVLGSALPEEPDLSAAMMVVTALVAHLATAEEAGQLWNRATRLRHAAVWAARQEPEVAALFLVLLTQDCPDDVRTLREAHVASTYAALLARIGIDDTED